MFLHLLVTTTIGLGAWYPQGYVDNAQPRLITDNYFPWRFL